MLLTATAQLRGKSRADSLLLALLAQRTDEASVPTHNLSLDLCFP